MGNILFLAAPFLIDATIAANAIAVNLFAQNLRATPFELGLLGFAWGITYSLGSFVSGRLADRAPRKMLLTLGLLTYGGVMIKYSFCSSVNQLIILGFLNGLGCAFFWPVFETFLHKEGDLKETNRRMGLFNLGWTMGLLFGSATGGYMMSLGPQLTFRILGGLIFMTLAYLLLSLKEQPKGIAPAREVQSDGKDKPPVPLKERLKFLYVAWVANFIASFASAATASIFPKVARVENIPDGLIGVSLSLMNLGQGVTFFALSRTSIWHYRMSPIFMLEGVSLSGMLLLGFGRSRSVYVLGMLLHGLGRGMSYASSLFYGLLATKYKGTNTGVNEMLIGSAFTFGPLLAGFVAQRIFLKAAFHLAAGIIALGWIIQLALMFKFDRDISD